MFEVKATTIAYKTQKLSYNSSVTSYIISSAFVWKGGSMEPMEHPGSGATGTGWLQRLLCQVRTFKTHLKWKYGTFRGSIGLKWLPQKNIRPLIVKSTLRGATWGWGSLQCYHLNRWGSGPALLLPVCGETSQNLIQPLNHREAAIKINCECVLTLVATFRIYIDPAAFRMYAR